MTLRIGTRGSELALWQARRIAKGLAEAHGTESELVVVGTAGDRERSRDLASFGGAGAFTKAIDAAQLDGRFEMAVHSLKDLPTAMPDGLLLAAVPERGPVEDCLVSAGGDGLDDLPAGARVGTGSPRRTAELRRLRPDVEVVGVRGNVPTRVGKVRSGDMDAVVLARAGLERLGLGASISEVFAVERMVPAAGQGALAVVVRADAEDALAAARRLDHRDSRIAVDVERHVLAELGAGCHTPIGVHVRAGFTDFDLPEPVGRRRGLRVEIFARLLSDDGSRVVERAADGPVVQGLVRDDIDAFLHDAAARAEFARKCGSEFVADLRKAGAQEFL